MVGEGEETDVGVSDALRSGRHLIAVVSSSKTWTGDKSTLLSEIGREVSVRG